MIKNSRKEENNGSSMCSLRQESVSKIKVCQKTTLSTHLVYNLMKTKSLDAMGDSQTLQTCQKKQRNQYMCQRKSTRQRYWSKNFTSDYYTQEPHTHYPRWDISTGSHKGKLQSKLQYINVVCAESTMVDHTKCQN